MRLIDADKLIMALNDYALTEAPDERECAGERRISSAVYSAIQNCMKAVEEQPTAFDVEKVTDEILRASCIARPMGWNRKREILFLDEFDLEHYEAIGNIFDNPELAQGSL